jgi:hypothetical protein
MGYKNYYKIVQNNCKYNVNKSIEKLLDTEAKNISRIVDYNDYFNTIIFSLNYLK